MTVQLEPGTIFAGFWIEGLIDRGGMAVVYRATDPSLERSVALKLIAPDLAQNEEFRRRFLRESRLAASLDHPNVVPIYEAGEERSLLYIAMRYVEGSDLRALLRREAPLSPDRTLQILSQIASALDTAHSRGLVHRDVKPANALLDEQEHVYLTDFGLTKQVSADATATPPGEMLGTLDYLAPEQIRGDEIDGRTDLYALACCLYQCLQGEPPFRRAQEIHTLWAHMEEEPPAPSEYPTLAGVLETALAKEREARYATCGELIAAAAEALGVDVPVPARRAPAPSRPALGPSPPRRVAERKVVSVLFVDLVAFTSRTEGMDPEDVGQILRPYHARVRAELEQYGGSVEKFIGDAVMALFGAPAAHEDDAERSLRAALAIREFAVEEGIQLRIGIATGEVLVTLGARADKGEVMAAGNVITTAARLEAAAPVNGILVDTKTYEATREVIEYGQARAISLKGKARPVDARQPIAARAPVSSGQMHGAPLVGREKERALLAGALGRAKAERSPQLITLVGTPGIGKSRLVFELLRAVEADSEPVSWLQGRCLPYGEGGTLSALAEIVKARTGILGTDSAEEAAQKLQSATELVDPTEREWVTRHLGPLVGVGSQKHVGLRQRGEAMAAWRRFFQAIAEAQPLVLVFEDVHWADENLLDFIDHLAEWSSGMPPLVLCTARPQLLDRRPGWGGGKPNAFTLSLGPLSDSETANLLSELLRKRLPAEQEIALLARVGGNPLYAEQYARMILERGEMDDLPLPESVHGIIAARLDLLPREDKALLQDAALIGKVFWTGALASLAGVDRAAAEGRLHTLERKEFVRRSARSSVAGEHEFVFRHVLVRDVAYGQIPRPERADKHRLAAEWIESLGRPEDSAEMLAHHYVSALEYARLSRQETDPFTDRARLSLRAAGDRALSLHAFPAAARFFRAALDLWPATDLARAWLVFSLGKAVYHAETGGADVLVEARNALHGAGDLGTAAEAEVLLANLAQHQGRRDLVVEHMDRAVALVDGLGATRSKAEVLADFAKYLSLASEHAQTVEVGGDALRIAKQLGLREVEAYALSTIGISRGLSGDSGGLADLRRSIEITEEIGSHLSADCCGMLADLECHMGDLTSCFELQARALSYAELFGHAGFVRWLKAERVGEGYWTGAWDEALDLADSFVVEAEAGARNFMEGYCRAMRGRIRLARGDAAGALEDATRALEFARAAEDLQTLYPALAFRARAEVLVGSSGQGEELTDELLTLWRSRLDAYPASSWTVDLGVALDQLGRGSELAEIASGIRMTTRWLQAVVSFTSGEFQAAGELFGHIGSLPDEALARLRAAQALSAVRREDEARSELSRALAFYRHVDAKAYIREAESLAKDLDAALVSKAPKP